MAADSTLLLNYGQDVLAVTHEGSLVPDLIVPINTPGENTDFKLRQKYSSAPLKRVDQYFPRLLKNYRHYVQ